MKDLKMFKEWEMLTTTLFDSYTLWNYESVPQICTINILKQILKDLQVGGHFQIASLLSKFMQV